MPQMNIHIKDLADKTPAIQTNGREVLDCSHVPLDVTLLESGMASGSPSVGIAFELPDGRLVILQTSLALWEGASAAFRGAKDRWASRS